MGEVEVSLFVNKQSDFIVLHSANLTIIEVLFVDFSNVSSVPFLEFPYHEQIYVKLPRTVQQGYRFKLYIIFRGVFPDQNVMEGFYRSEYEINGKTKYKV